MHSSLFTRRHWLTQAGLGFGAWALLDLLERESQAAAPLAPVSETANPLAPKPPHFPAKAKSVIFLMMAGGPSQMETFDPKPVLNQLSGQRMPASFGTIPAQFTDVTKRPLLGCKLKFRPCGQSGLPISEAFPCLQDHADRLAVVRSCYHDAFNHGPAQYALLTGQWATFGTARSSAVALASVSRGVAGGWANGVWTRRPLPSYTGPVGEVAAAAVPVSAQTATRTRASRVSAA